MGQPDDSRSFSAEHRARRIAASIEPSRGPRTPWYRSRVHRNLAVIAVTTVAAIAIGTFADVANPDYPPARSLADRLDAAWRAIDAGAAPDDAAAAEGLRAHILDSPRGQQTILTHPEPASDGRCYALTFGTGVVTVAGTLRAPAPGCTPTPPVLFEVRGTWSEVLPSPRTTPAWFVPVLTVLFAVALYAVTDIVLTLLMRRAGVRP